MSAYKNQRLSNHDAVHHAVTDQSAQGALKRSAVPALQKKSAEEEMPAQGKFTAQFATSPEEEKMPAQGKFTAQLAAAPEEEEKPAQGKFTAQLAAQGEEELQMKQPAFSQSLQKKEGGDTPSAGNKTGMPDGLKSGIEGLSGIAMDDVKVHYNSSHPSQLNALAYAQGTDIHIGPGQEKHLPHEAWHVVQQKEGRVSPTMQMKEGTPVNDDPGLEKEADEMGAKALQKR